MRRTRGRSGPNHSQGNSSNYNSGGGGGGNYNSGYSQNRRPSGTPTRHQVFDSNGPDVRIRGNASQVYDKYINLARDAQVSGDRVKLESYLQHAEHYYRIMLAIQEATGEMYQQRPQQGDDEMQQGDGSSMQMNNNMQQDPSQMPQPTTETVDMTDQSPTQAAVA